MEIVVNYFSFKKIWTQNSESELCMSEHKGDIANSQLI